VRPRPLNFVLGPPKTFIGESKDTTKLWTPKLFLLGVQLLFVIGSGPSIFQYGESWTLSKFFLTGSLGVRVNLCTNQI
jgi:hypothetical protein